MLIREDELARPPVVLPPDIRERTPLRFWMAGGYLQRLVSVLDIFWDHIRDKFAALFGASSALTCTPTILRLLAYQRDIEHLHGESEELFRLRVHYAFANTRDSGSIAGFQKIWARLNLGELRQLERVESMDWDVILLTIDEQVFAAMVDSFLETLIAQYGRTCRRYRCQSIARVPEIVRAFEFSGEYFYATAVYPPKEAGTPADHIIAMTEE